MTAPRVNPTEVAHDVFGLFAGLTSMMFLLGNDIVAFFLDCVPERGRALWDRFLVFRAENQGASFEKFVQHIIRSEALRLILPKGCLRDLPTKMVLMLYAQQALQATGATTDSDLARAHFGDGPSYEAVRAAACQGCELVECPHWRKET